MLNFIIISNTTKNKREYSDVINKTMLDEEIFYDIHEFNSINKGFKERCCNFSSSAIFIIDNDIDNDASQIVNVIRKELKLFKAFIIVIDKIASLDVLNLTSKYSFLIDVINDVSLIEKKMVTDIKFVLDLIYDREKTLTFVLDKALYKIPFCDIFYIEKEVNSKKSHVVTKTGRYRISKNLNELANLLDKRFFRSHQSALVNKDNITKIDFKNNRIVFDENTVCKLISRENKKELKKIFTK